MVTPAARDAVDATLAPRRWLYAVVGVALMAPWMIYIYWPVAHGLDVTGHPIGRDFINIWVGPQLAFGGKLHALFDFPAYQRAIGDLFGHSLPFHTWVYPLYTLPAFWPLGKLPYFVALAVWTFGLFALFACVTLREIAPDKRLAALLVLALAPASLINTVGGQNGFLTAALLLGGILALDRRPILAGVLFGLLTFKPHLGLVLPLVLITLGAWRVIASACVVAAALVAMSIAMFGTEPWLAYLHSSSALQVAAFEHFNGFFKFMMTSVLAGGRTFGLSVPASLAIQAVVSLVVVVTACWAVRRTQDPCRRAFVLAAAAPLVTPYAFNYDLTALAAVQVWMLCGRLPWRPQWSALGLLGWSAPLLLMYGNIFGLGIGPVILILMFWASVQEAVRVPDGAGMAVGSAAARQEPASSPRLAPT
jgi:hypothetical protein